MWYHDKGEGELVQTPSSSGKSGEGVATRPRLGFFVPADCAEVVERRSEERTAVVVVRRMLIDAQKG